MISPAIHSETPDAFLSQEQCRSLFEQLTGMTRGGGDLKVSLISRWIGCARWSRNRILVAADMQTTDLHIARTIRGTSSWVRTTRRDDAGLQEAVRLAEDALSLGYETPEDEKSPFVDEAMLTPRLFIDTTYGFGAEARSVLVQKLIGPTEVAGFVSTGMFQIKAEGHATAHSDGLFRYYPTTAVECSMTVRDRKGTASGWAGVNHHDLAKIDPEQLSLRALEKAQRSVNPSAVEPGRYTTILEPQATADLFGLLTPHKNGSQWGPLGRFSAERGTSPFSAGPGWTKISERVIDTRLTMTANPMDPDGGFLPFARYSGTPYRDVTWIDRGILRELSYDKRYAVTRLGTEQALLDPGSFHLAAADGVQTRSTEEMISATDRGLLVTRFSGLTVIRSVSLLSTGYTRDGLWLIERGKITRAVKNMRISESPLFVFNQIRDIGPAVRVYRPDVTWIAPALRVTDFNFTGLVDAV